MNDWTAVTSHWDKAWFDICIKPTPHKGRCNTHALWVPNTLWGDLEHCSTPMLNRLLATWGPLKHCSSPFHRQGFEWASCNLRASVVNNRQIAPLIATTAISLSPGCHMLLPLALLCMCPLVKDVSCFRLVYHLSNPTLGTCNRCSFSLHSFTITTLRCKMPVGFC